MIERVGTFWSFMEVFTQFVFAGRADPAVAVDRAERAGLFTAKPPERNNNDR
jgi:hypothetical protein